MGPAHLAAGLAAKSAARKVPLWVLLVASEALDLLCFGFMALGLERAGTSRVDFSHGIQVTTPGWIPWSHGLFMAVVWSLLAAVICGLIFHDRRSGIVIGLVVFSHWALDFIVHPGELPLLFAGSPTVGLGLWTTGPGLIASAVLEVALIGAGLVLYFRGRKLPAPATT
ncbi:MAG TPA: hypothetical protein VMT46_11380 [Anaerolineaceae bacterium]|nr:hypothetical protein [Anaerolineaceae bacterium]